MTQSLKERVVKQLSPYFKSRVRANLHRMGVLRPRTAEQLVLNVIAADGAATFLQIGVNDGQYADPLNLAVHRGYLRGTLVEPQPAFYAAMQKTYRGISGMEFVNKAISDEPGTLPFYAFDPANALIPAWAHGSASLNRAHLMKFEDRIPNVEQHIIEVPVELITVDTLLAGSAYRQPDLLVIDAEGHDARILRQFDFNSFRPILILYEEESMSAVDAADIRQSLTSAGYKIKALGQDSAALRGDSRSAAQLLN